MSEPTTFEAVEAAERESRRAAWLADQQAAADQQTREFERQQRQADVEARQAAIVTERTALHATLRRNMGAIGALVENLNNAVTELEKTVLADAELCREHGGLEPLDLELVRLAIGLGLSQSWDDAPTADPVFDAVPVLAAAQQLSMPGSPIEFHWRLQSVLAEAEHAFGSAPLSRWLAIGVEPAWGDHSPAADRTRAAARLLERLKENHNGK